MISRIILISNFVIFSHLLSGQPRVLLDVSEIEPVIHEWSFATNTGNEESLEKIYGEQVIFYTKELSRGDVVREKMKRFHQSPKLHYRILGEVAYQPYSSGVVKCEFTTEVLNDKRADTYRSYLLVDYHEDHYVITGESDEETDQKKRYHLSIGEPMDFDVRDNKSGDSLHQGATSSGESSASLKDFDSIVMYIRSQQTVDVRRDHVFALIGILFCGGLLIFVADRLGATKGRRSARRDTKSENEFEQYKTQTDFQAFVLTLFDPLYFRCRRLVHSDRDQSSHITQLIDFVFARKDVEATFLAQTVYRKNTTGNDVYIIDTRARKRCEHLQKELGKQLYFVIGVGGHPHDPHDIFLLPGAHVRESMTISQLMPYQKHGMFYWASEKKMLV
jgi:hypothetical protein